MFIVADIGGEFDSFLSLIEGVTEKIILVGDLNDRGHKSKEMIQWAIDNQDRAITLHSNHGDMMVDFYNGVDRNVYDPNDFIRNGGDATLESYGINHWTEMKSKIPKEHIEFLATRSLFVEGDDVIVSHAPVPHPDWLEREINKYEIWEWIWNRSAPVEMDKWQVFGHNSHWGLQVNKQEKWICLDASRQRCTTGMFWPSQKIVQKPYDVKPKASAGAEI